jgi:uncharacterized protein YndB with AHSA1/START domain
MTDSKRAEAAGREVAISRVLDAPREAVFKAWTDPDQLASWWGPVGFDTPRDSVEVDLRVGGHVNLLMVEAGGGAQFSVRFEILELVEPELLVLRSEAMPEIGVDEPTTVRVEFHEQAGKTRLTLRDGPYTREVRDATESGWDSSLGKLAEQLAGPTA